MKVTPTHHLSTHTHRAGLPGTRRAPRWDRAPHCPSEKEEQGKVVGGGEGRGVSMAFFQPSGGALEPHESVKTVGT